MKKFSTAAVALVGLVLAVVFAIPASAASTPTATFAGSACKSGSGADKSVTATFQQTNPTASSAVFSYASLNAGLANSIPVQRVSSSDAVLPGTLTFVDVTWGPSGNISGPVYFTYTAYWGGNASTFGEYIDFGALKACSGARKR